MYSLRCSGLQPFAVAFRDGSMNDGAAVPLDCTRERASLCQKRRQTHHLEIPKSKLEADGA